MTRLSGPVLAPGVAGLRHGAGERAWPLAGGLLAGTVLDAIFGDPRRGHPVAAFGRSAQALQERMYRDTVPRGAAVSGDIGRAVRLGQATTAAAAVGAAAVAALIARFLPARPDLRHSEEGRRAGRNGG